MTIKTIFSQLNVLRIANGRTERHFDMPQGQTTSSQDKLQLIWARASDGDYLPIADVVGTKTYG